MTFASGAMPLVPMPLSSPTMRLATHVPCPSVSDFEQSCSGPTPPPKMAVSRLHGIVLSTNSTLSRSSGCDGSMPESITATLMPAPLVVFHAWRTPSRSSSHCRTPGAFSPLKASKSCSGSGWKALVWLTRSSQAALTPFWPLILACEAGALRDDGERVDRREVGDDLGAGVRDGLAHRGGRGALREADDLDPEAVAARLRTSPTPRTGAPRRRPPRAQRRRGPCGPSGRACEWNPPDPAADPSAAARAWGANVTRANRRQMRGLSS